MYLVNYNRVQKLMKVQNWDMGLELYLYLVELIVCIIVDYVGLMVSKNNGIPVMRRRRECVFSFSQRCRTQCGDRTGFPLQRKHNLQFRALVQYMGYFV